MKPLLFDNRISRTRGGAIANPTSTEPPLRYRTSKMADEKARIAKAAAAMVHPGDTIGLNGGTSTTEVAREIVRQFPGIAKVAVTLRESVSASHNNWGAMLYDAAADEAE